MWVRALLFAAAVALLAPAPASALQNKVVLVAYGEDVTHCVVTANNVKQMLAGGEDRWRFFGRTECSVPVQQTGQAKLDNDVPSLVKYGELCTGLRTTCLSGGSAFGWELGENSPGGFSYRVTLVAPLGQGWIASPEECAGAGTDRLDCVFTSNGSTDTVLLNNV